MLLLDEHVVVTPDPHLPAGARQRPPSRYRPPRQRLARTRRHTRHAVPGWVQTRPLAAAAAAATTRTTTTTMTTTGDAGWGHF